MTESTDEIRNDDVDIASLLGIPISAEQQRAVTAPLKPVGWSGRRKSWA